MTRKKLRNLQRELEKLRAGKHNIRPDDLVRLAQKLGRREVNRGKHPTYVNDFFDEGKPISIPAHSHLLAYTAISILDDLELDIQRWSEKLDEEERKANEQQRKALPPTTIRTNSHSR